MPEWPYISEVTDFADIPPNFYIEPIEIAAGETVLFYRSLSLYPSSAWTLKYSLRGVQGSSIDFASTPKAASNDHQVQVLAAVTVAWAAGQYTAQGYAVNTATGETHLFFEGLIKIKPYLPAADPAQDQRTHAKRCLDLVESVLEGRATDDILETEIGGTTIRRLPVDQLLKLRNYYKSEVKAEVAKARVHGGRATGRNIYMRFSTPK